MSYVRTPVLSPEKEKMLKKLMLPLWLQGMQNGLPGKKLTGLQIAEKLFTPEKITIDNKEIENPFTKVPHHYIYYYRQKFNSKKRNDDNTKNKYYGKFLPRRNPSFAKNTPSSNRKLRKTRYKYRPKKLGLMSVEEFISKLNKNVPKELDSEYSRRVRAYCITHYYSPLRASEIYERNINDFEWNNKRLTIHLLRKKKKEHQDDDEPINIPLSYPLVNELIDYLESQEWKRTLKNGTVNLRPFNISRTTALNYVKEAFGKKYYCHYFRFNWITEEADQPGTTIRKLMTKTRLTARAAEKYIFTDEKAEEEIDEARAERYRKRGVI